jgi:hypothetical protein
MDIVYRKTSTHKLAASGDALQPTPSAQCASLKLLLGITVLMRGMSSSVVPMHYYIRGMVVRVWVGVSNDTSQSGADMYCLHSFLALLCARLCLDGLWRHTFYDLSNRDPTSRYTPGVQPFKAELSESAAEDLTGFNRFSEDSISWRMWYIHWAWSLHLHRQEIMIYSIFFGRTTYYTWRTMCSGDPRTICQMVDHASELMQISGDSVSSGSWSIPSAQQW